MFSVLCSVTEAGPAGRVFDVVARGLDLYGACCSAVRCLIPGASRIVAVKFWNGMWKAFAKDWRTIKSFDAIMNPFDNNDELTHFLDRWSQPDL